MGNKHSSNRRHDNYKDFNSNAINQSENFDPFAQQQQSLPPPPQQGQNRNQGQGQQQQQTLFSSGNYPPQPKSDRAPFFESLTTPPTSDDPVSVASALAAKFIIPHEKGPDRWSSNYIRDSVVFTPEGAQISIGALSSVKPFSGGELISRETGLGYGVYSCDMISTNVKGHVTAFFLISNGINEIDIELTGRVSTVCWVNVWKGKEQHPVKIDLGFDAAQDWHTYAIEWRRDFIAWYVDGRKVYERSDVEVADPTTTEFNLAMNSWTHNNEDQWAGKFEMPTDGRKVVSCFRNMSYTP
ncbi:MAG: concanavalin A-like lectin/glucanase domain-containing protein [Linnemannia elongata]|nr:MAG: concanavalin A-like lectin/glucanase domain-containing protein [Linnemannia elongata]